MPRQTPGRTASFESNVAANLARERKRMDLTLEALATRMGDRGCPIQPSALHKIEKADPPRRVTVNELMAMAFALELRPMDLVADPDQSLPAEAWSLVRQVEDHQRAIDAAEHGIADAVEQLRGLLANSDRQRGLLKRWLAEDWADWPEVRRHLAPALARPKETS